MEVKKCTNCGETKHTSFFYKYKNGSLKNPCRECIVKLNRIWKRKNPDKIKAQNSRWKERYPEKYFAKLKLRGAVLTGKIKPLSLCENCGKEGLTHGHHHNGYSLKHLLDVIWLCPKCHVGVHRT